jgi:hypothetical protein
VTWIRPMVAARVWGLLFSLVALDGCGSTETLPTEFDRNSALASCGPACESSPAQFEAAFDACMLLTAACAGHGLPCDAYCATQAGCVGTLRGFTVTQGADCPVTCADGTTACGGVCVDTTTDLLHCGECGKACGDGQTCVGSACSTPQPAPECAADGDPCGTAGTCCGGGCVDASSDSAHCGSACEACGDGQACCDGACTAISEREHCGGCNVQCSEDESCCSTGCTDTSVDPQNCGECGSPCAAGTLCCLGQCAEAETDVGCACTSGADCAPLDDGNACNGAVACIDRQCVRDPASVPPCDTGSAGPCRLAQCNPITGACEASPVANGTVCDDADPCTQADACQAGVCVGLELAPACECVQDGECDDNNACNGQETCDADGAGKTCQPGEPVICIADVATPCRVPMCDVATGGCTSSPAADGTPCTVPGGACAGKGYCALGQCESVPPATCGE